MRSVVPMKTAKIGYFVISVLFCVLGIVLITSPGTSVVWLGRLLGVGMIVFGAIKLVGYFSRDLFRLAFQYDLAFGILLIAIGIVTLARPNGAMSFLCIVFGIPVLADGLFKIQISLDAKRFGIGQSSGGAYVRNWAPACHPAVGCGASAHGPDGNFSASRRHFKHLCRVVLREDCPKPEAGRH